MKKLIFLTIIGFTLVACGSKSNQQGNESAEESKNVATETVASTKISVDKPTVVDFSADWCSWCKKLEPIIEKLEDKYSEAIEFKTIDTDEHPELAKAYNIRGLPTLVFLDKNGNEIGRIEGFSSEEIIETEILKIK